MSDYNFNQFYGKKIDKELIDTIINDYRYVITNEELDGIEGNIELSINKIPLIRLKCQLNKEYIAEINIPTIEFNDKKVEDGVCFIDLSTSTSNTKCTTDAFTFVTYADAINKLFMVRNDYIDVGMEIAKSLQAQKLRNELGLDSGYLINISKCKYKERDDSFMDKVNRLRLR